jgi:hypothetical protein
MKGSIHLTEGERKRLLKTYPSGEPVRVARRAHVVLLRADGLHWEQMRYLLQASYDLIAEVRRTFLTRGVDGVLGDTGASENVPWWLGGWAGSGGVFRRTRRRTLETSAVTGRARRWPICAAANVSPVPRWIGSLTAVTSSKPAA